MSHLRESRFDQLGYKVYKNLQQLLVKAANKEDIGSEFEFVTDFYGQDFAIRQLDCQLNILSTNIPGSQHDVVSVLNYLKILPDTQKMLLSEIYKLAKLIVVMSATNSVSERSFSALRRVKTYLGNTMTQTRLNSIMVIHVHKNVTEKLNLVDIANEFVAGSEHQLTIFGKFIASDTD